MNIGESIAHTTRVHAVIDEDDTNDAFMRLSLPRGCRGMIQPPAFSSVSDS